jgi:hypothetical protein
MAGILSWAVAAECGRNSRKLWRYAERIPDGSMSFCVRKDRCRILNQFVIR